MWRNKVPKRKIRILPNASSICSLKEKVELASSLLGVVGKLGIAVGIIVVFLYLGELRFFVAEVSAADSLILAYVAFAAGSYVVAAVVYGAFAVVWLFLLIEWIATRCKPTQATNGNCGEVRLLGLWPSTRMQNVFLAAASLLVFSEFCLLVVGAFLGDSRRGMQVAFLFTGLLASGLVAISMLMYFSRAAEKPFGQNKLHSIGVTFVAALIVLVIVPGNLGTVVHKVMSGVGLRHERTAIELSEKNFRRLTSVSETLGLSLSSCAIDGTDSHLVLDVDVLWNGVGTKSLIGVRSVSESDETLKLEMEASGVSPLRSVALPKQCKNTVSSSQKQSESTKVSPGGTPIT